MKIDPNQIPHSLWVQIFHKYKKLDRDRLREKRVKLRRALNSMTIVGLTTTRELAKQYDLPISKIRYMVSNDPDHVKYPWTKPIQENLAKKKSELELARDKTLKGKRNQLARARYAAKKAGKPPKPSRAAVQTPEDFATRISLDSTTGCQMWTGSKMTDGYGYVVWKGKIILAHRLSMELAGINIKDKQLARSPDCPSQSRLCVTPAHWIITDKLINKFKLRGVKPSNVLSLEKAGEMLRLRDLGNHTDEELITLFNTTQTVLNSLISQRMIHNALRPAPAPELIQDYDENTETAKRIAAAQLARKPRDDHEANFRLILKFKFPDASPQDIENTVLDEMNKYDRENYRASRG